MTIRPWWMIVPVLLLAGCKPDAAVKRAETFGSGTVPNNAGSMTPPASAAARESAAAPAGPTGAVSGTILFAGKAPARVAIDTSMDPACNLGHHQVMTEQYAVNAGKLGNVFIYVKDGPGVVVGYGGPLPQPTVLDQQNCQYVPHVVGVMQGGYVEFRNSDPTMHNIHTMPTAIGNETIDISQGPKGPPVTKRFDKPELMIPVRCNNHPWMNAFINVSATPFFAVSDANGHFDLRGLRPGTYTLGAVHEKLGEKTIQVTVPANGTAKTELSFAIGN